MGCALEWFGTIATVLLALQLLRKVFPWIYENFVGPKLSGGVPLKKFGKWAGKAKKVQSAFFIICVYRKMDLDKSTKFCKHRNKIVLCNRKNN